MKKITQIKLREKIPVKEKESHIPPQCTNNKQITKGSRPFHTHPQGSQTDNPKTRTKRAALPTCIRAILTTVVYVAQDRHGSLAPS